MKRSADARPVRAFLFDMGNVLLDFDFEPAFRTLAKAGGKTPEQVRDYFIQSGLEVLFDGGQITSRRFYSEVCKALDLALSYERFERIWNHIFTPDRRMASLVRKLGKKHRLVLLSNTNAMHARHAERRYKSILGLFDRRLYSFREKRRKPDAGLYRLAVRACKAKAGEVFYIDDRADLTEAAAELGLRTFTYRKNFAELERELVRLGAL
jgi:putative hydrolase of the HAD superfamily